MKNIELELKFKVDNLRKIEKRLIDLGARFKNKTIGIDTYFLVPDNDGRKYLRVREQGDKRELAFHFAQSSYQTDEWETGIDDARTAKKILEKNRSQCRRSCKKNKKKISL